jgi:UDP-N-acetylmuramoyl-tripeptide--D-alanyl-D-alanine ligase
MTLFQAAEAMGVNPPVGSRRCKIAGVCTDSRRLQAGELFFAIEGDRFDGHDFVKDALEAGACCAVVSRAECVDASLRSRLLIVRDVVTALATLATQRRRDFAGAVIAVTGSNGKTTTKEMIAHLLGGQMSGSASPKSFNNHIGVPLTVLAASSSDEFLVAEIGTNRPGEIRDLAAIVQPDIAVITSVGPTHLEGLGSVEAIAEEKASILESLSPGGSAIVNVDDEPIVEPCRRRFDIVGYGLSERADVRVADVRWSSGRLTFTVDRQAYRLPVLGAHNALNAAAAILVGREMDLDDRWMSQQLAEFLPPPMRLEVSKVGDLTIINDAYNANPQSMHSALRSLQEFPCSGKRIIAAGDMMELGETAEFHHEQLGRLAAGVDELVVVGQFSGCVSRGAIEAGMPSGSVTTCCSVEEAGRQLEGKVRDGDVVLIKGSRAVGMERLVAHLSGASARP